MTVSKWDVLDACSHNEWKYVSEVVRELSDASGSNVSIARIFHLIEVLEDEGYAETQKERKRLRIRKTRSGIAARERAREGTADFSRSGLNPAR